MAAPHRLFGLSEVTAILSTAERPVPEWRIKNFTQAAAYRLPPTAQLGTGRGSRRMFDWLGVVKLALADHLAEFGFAPESIGTLLPQIRERDLMADCAIVCEGSGWRVASAVRKPMDIAEPERGFFWMRLRPFVRELEVRRDATQKGN